MWKTSIAQALTMEKVPIFQYISSLTLDIESVLELSCFGKRSSHNKVFPKPEDLKIEKAISFACGKSLSKGAKRETTRRTTSVGY